MRDTIEDVVKLCSTSILWGLTIKLLPFVIAAPYIAKSIVPRKRLVAARCRICHRVYWWFSDEEPWEEFERRLTNHLWYHVREGTLKPADVTHWQDHYDMLWFRVYDPSKALLTEKQMMMLHPELIPEHQYEELKALAKECPSCMIRVVRQWFKEALGEH